ncbi:MAG: FtsX-like permease family protein, partial [Planctomycetota bacterium]
KEIAASVLMEGGILSLAGAVCGFFLSLLVVMAMRRIGITTLGFGKPLIISDIPWRWVALVLGAGMLAAMVGMIAPLLRVRTLSIVEAVRAGQIAYRPDPGRFVRSLVLALLPGMLLLTFVLATPPLGERQEEVFRIVTRIAIWLSLTFGLALLLPGVVQRAVLWVLRLLLTGRRVEQPVALASTRGSHHRVFGSTLGVGLVLAALLSIHGITESLKDEASRFSDRTLSGRIFLQTHLVKKETVAAARETPGVVDFYSLSAEVHSPFPIRGVPVESALRWVEPFRESAELAREFSAGESIILSEALAANYGYLVGDQVRLSTYARAYPVRVAVISDEFGYFPDDRNFAMLALPTFRAIFCVDDEQGAQYVFHVDPNHDPDDVLAGMLARLPRDEVLKLRTAREIKSFYLGDMNRDFWIFQVILILTSILAFVGLWNSLTVALLERRREIGLLRTLGFTTSQVAGMLTAESAALGLVGGCLALAAGLPIAHDLVEAIRIISRQDVRAVASGLEIALVPVGAVVLSVLATIPPALRLRGQAVASTTRME